MFTRRPAAAFVFILALCGLSLSAGQNTTAWAADGGQKPYILGTKDIPIPKISRPERGKTVIDPVFGTKITRLTDPSDGWGKPNRRHSYAPFSSFNSDNTFLSLHGGQWHLYDNKNCKYLKPLKGLNRGDFCSARWDAKDPNTFYFAGGTSLKKYNVKTDGSTVVHDFKKDFPAMTWLQLPGYVEPTLDKRYWGFIAMESSSPRGKQVAKFVYDMKQDKVLWSAQSSGRYVFIGPYAERVVVGGYSDLTSYKLDHTDPVKIKGLGHCDVGIDAEGNEVITGKFEKGDFYIMINMATGKVTRLISMIHGTSWSEMRQVSGTGTHFSANCYGTPGWVLVSTYGPKRQKDIWCSHSLYMLKLDPKADLKNPTVWRVAHTHSAAPARKSYWKETHGSIDRYGRSVIFASAWDDLDGAAETYRCDLPDGWYEKLMGKAKAKQLREKVAKKLGMTVKELVGK